MLSLSFNLNAGQRSHLTLASERNGSLKALGNGFSESEIHVGNRRDLLGKIAGVFAVGSLSLLEVGVSPSMAVDAEGATVYKSGKAPLVPDQKPKDKNDVSGTRKDPTFLRSLSACKSQCETSVAADGFARSKEECLQDCQDICCTTYEQCSFAIIPRM